MKQRLIPVVLIVAAVIAVGVGMSLLFSPVAFEAGVGVAVGRSANALSEARAPGGGLIAVGMLIGAGVFVRRVRRPSMLLAGTVFVAYGVARGFSILVDGSPGAALMIVMAVELAVGGLCLALVPACCVETRPSF